MKCHPIFSEQDADLRDMAWYCEESGPAIHTVNFPRHGGEKPITYMLSAHRLVLSRMIGRMLLPGEIGDHANRNPMDNRRENLRVTDALGNSQNVTCGLLRGTSWDKKINKWRATVKHKNKSMWLGAFDDRQEAAKAAAAKRRELNFLGEPQYYLAGPSGATLAEEKGA